MVLQAMQVIRALDERFAADYVVRIITGQLTPQIKMFRHEGLPEFGIGKINRIISGIRYCARCYWKGC